MKGVWYVILDIDQRIRPTVVQAGANVTLEDCDDTLHQVVEKAQQLFYLPCERRRRKPNARLRFSRVMKQCLDKTKEGCNFCYKVDANKTVIVGVISVTGSRTFLFSSYTRELVGNALRWV